MSFVSSCTPAGRRLCPVLASPRSVTAWRRIGSCVAPASAWVSAHGKQFIWKLCTTWKTVHLKTVKHGKQSIWKLCTTQEMLAPHKNCQYNMGNALFWKCPCRKIWIFFFFFKLRTVCTTWELFHWKSFHTIWEMLLLGNGKYSIWEL